MHKKNKNKPSGTIVVFTSSDATSSASGHLPYPLELSRSETTASSNYGSQPHDLSSQDLGDNVNSTYDVSSPGLFISEETLVQISKNDKSYIIRSRELNQANLDSILDAGWTLTGYQGNVPEAQISRLLDIPDLDIQLVFVLAEEEPIYNPPKKDRDDDSEGGAGGSGDIQSRIYIKSSSAGTHPEAESSSQSTTYNTEGNSNSFNLLPFLFIGSLCYLSYHDTTNLYKGVQILTGIVTEELFPDYLLLQS